MLLPKIQTAKEKLLSTLEVELKEICKPEYLQCLPPLMLALDTAISALCKMTELEANRLFAEVAIKDLKHLKSAVIKALV